jgi:hypothetical protein
MAGPLTPVDARVAAAILTHHPRRQPTWAGIAQRLTEWADQQPQTEHEEGEMPSQDGTFEPQPGRMEPQKNEPRTAFLLVRQSEALTDTEGRLMHDSSNRTGAM